MAGKITSLFRGFMKNISPNAIDYMSINRLRLTISANSDLPFFASAAERTQSFARVLRSTLGETVPFEFMRMYPDPFGICPLSALLYFTCEQPCRVRYTIIEEENAEGFSFLSEYRKGIHLVPVFGLYPDTENKVFVELLDASDHCFANRTIVLRTPALIPDMLENPGLAPAYPTLKDNAGNVRYFLQIPFAQESIIPLQNGQFLTMDKRFQVLSQGQFYPTHLYEMDALGCVTRTYYVGNGIVRILGEKEDDGNIILETPDSAKGIMKIELDRETGNLVRSGFISNNTEDITSKEPAHAKWDWALMHHLCTQPLIDKFEAYAVAPFMTVGWLRQPVPYKGASIETSAAVKRSYLRDKYGLSFYITGDTLMIETHGDELQGVVFSNNDRIYQLDLTAPPLTDENMKKHCYVLAVPFTEMFSGTYTIIVRFRDGGQETLAETITLSRSRN